MEVLLRGLLLLKYLQQGPPPTLPPRILHSGSSFADLKLSPELLKGLYVEMKFQKPSKIQAISLPWILNPPYKDLTAPVAIGSGKTTCLVLGMLSRVDPNLKAPQALCICPTRELAIQVLLFSVTFNETVKNFVAKIVKDYNQLFVKKEELSLASVKPYKVYCLDENTKIQIIIDRIFDLGENLGQRMIFVPTKHSASKLQKQLVDAGYTVTSIQGAINPEDRDEIVKEFRDGLTQVLVTTDRLARGFDQQEVHPASLI